MLAARGYKTKKDLKAAVGTQLTYTETSFFGKEYKTTGKFAVVGPDANTRKWFAEVTTVDDKITNVS